MAEIMRRLVWRRLDAEGIELLDVLPNKHGFIARGTVVTAANGGVSVVHTWSIDSSWRTRRLVVRSVQDDRSMTLARTDGGWTVDGRARPDLNEAEEPDLSLTPFCNTIAIQKLDRDLGASIELDVAYVDGSDLSVTRSRQRYERFGSNKVRYVDLGLYSGFHADLSLDDDGFVAEYEGLFERIATATDMPAEGLLRLIQADEEMDVRV